MLQVSLDQTGFGKGEFSEQERASLPEQFEAALIDGLNARGLFPLDVALAAQRTYRGGAIPIDRLERTPALTRAKHLDADVLLIVDIHVGRRDLLHACRETGRRFLARTTVVAITLEVLRVSDGTRLLMKSPAPAPGLMDVELACAPGGGVRRLPPEELTDAAVSHILTVLLGR